jgi:hypothetical protein
MNLKIFEEWAQTQSCLTHALDQFWRFTTVVVGEATVGNNNTICYVAGTIMLSVFMDLFARGVFTMVRTISLQLGIYQFRTQEGHLFIGVVGPNCAHPSSALMARGRPGAIARLRSSIQILLVLGKPERGFQEGTIMASLGKEQADHASNELTIKSLLGLSAGWWPGLLRHMRLCNYSNPRIFEFLVKFIEVDVVVARELFTCNGFVFFLRFLLL